MFSFTLVWLALLWLSLGAKFELPEVCKHDTKFSKIFKKLKKIIENLSNFALNTEICIVFDEEFEFVVGRSSF